MLRHLNHIGKSQECREMDPSRALMPPLALSFPVSDNKGDMGFLEQVLLSGLRRVGFSERQYVDLFLQIALPWESKH